MVKIETSKLNPLAGKANGRSVKFSQASWQWYYADTKGGTLEAVRGTVYVVRKGR